jgi:hypothetical protein
MGGGLYTKAAVYYGVNVGAYLGPLVLKTSACALLTFFKKYVLMNQYIITITNTTAITFVMRFIQYRLLRPLSITYGGNTSSSYVICRPDAPVDNNRPGRVGLTFVPYFGSLLLHVLGPVKS